MKDKSGLLFERVPTPNFISSVRVFTFSNYTRAGEELIFFNLDHSVSVSVDRLKGSLGETVSKSKFSSLSSKGALVQKAAQVSL